MKKAILILVAGLLFSGNGYAFSLTLPVLECKWDNEEQLIDLKQIEKKVE